MRTKIIKEVDTVMTKHRLARIITGLDIGRLTDLEDKFVEACERRFKMFGNLADPMEKKLEEIYQEKTQ